MPKDRAFELERLYTAENLDQVREEYDRIAADYDAGIIGDFGWVGHRRIVEASLRHVAREARVLDAGAGSGLVGEGLAAAGYTTLDGLDLSDAMLDQARRKGVYRGLRRMALGGPLDYPTDAYDAAISAGVFTPGHAPADSLDELVRVVRPGGHVIFTLRSDRPPEGFADKIRALERAGSWELVERGKEFQSMAKGEPEVRHRVWVYRVCASEGA